MLRAQGELTQDVLVTWAIESPTPGVVLVSVVIEGPRSVTPLHWRGGDWTKPPLDIEVNPTNGAVQALQVVLQDEHVQRGHLDSKAAGVAGIPVVEVTDWSEDRYRDVRCEVQVTRGPTDELVIRLGESPVASRSGASGLLMFGWDASVRLCEIVIGPLGRNEWDDIDAFAGDIGGSD